MPYTLPTQIQTSQAPFDIRNKGDFRMVLDCFNALNDKELSGTERLYCALIIFYEDFDEESDFPEPQVLEECIRGMFDFFNQNSEYQSNTHDVNVIDWEKDSNLLVSAINKVAGTEIRALDYLHWWTFLSYFTAIGESPFATVTSIRYKMAKDIKLEESEKKYKRDNPQFFNVDLRSAEQREADEYVRKLWGSN